MGCAHIANTMACLLIATATSVGLLMLKYIIHNIVPLDLRDRLQRARIVITNDHAFKARETMQAPRLVKGHPGRT
jgi:hypothetical protein